MAETMELPNFAELRCELARNVESMRQVEKSMATQLETLANEFAAWRETMTQSYEQHGVKAASLCAQEEERDRLLQQKLQFYEAQCSSNDMAQREYQSELAEMTGSIREFQRKKSGAQEAAVRLEQEIGSAKERVRARNQQIEQVTRKNKAVEAKLRDEYRAFRKATGIHVEASADTTLRFHFSQIVRDRSDVACYIDVDTGSRYKAKGCEPMVPEYDELARKLLVSDGNTDALREFFIGMRKAFQHFYNQ